MHRRIVEARHIAAEQPQHVLVLPAAETDRPAEEPSPALEPVSRHARRLDQPGEQRVRVGRQPLVGVDPQHPRLTALGEREGALRAEPVERAAEHPRTVACGDGLGVVRGRLVDDHDDVGGEAE